MRKNCEVSCDQAIYIDEKKRKKIIAKFGCWFSKNLNEIFNITLFDKNKNKLR